MSGHEDRSLVVWDCQPSEVLDRYLIQHVENPCINAQSVLLRALLIDALFPDRFIDLIHQEMRFAACALTGLNTTRFRPVSRPSTQRMGRDSMTTGMRGSDAIRNTPSFLNDCEVAGIDLAQLQAQLQEAEVLGWDAFVSPFEERWRNVLSGLKGRASVLELACGSANDARYYPRYGLEPFIDYTGVDHCRKNVNNAARHLPAHRFIRCDACAMPLTDRSHDYVFACDLLEHLSSAGIDEVLCEATRVARKEIWLSCFNAKRIATHEIRETDGCYWNTLSLPELQAGLRRHGFASYVVDVAREWAENFPGYHHYNEQACVIVAASR